MSNTRVYIGNLPPRVRDREVEDLFVRYGRIRELNVKNGYAFLEFDDPRDADDAVRHVDGQSFDGARLRVEFARGGRAGGGGGGGGGGGSSSGGGGGGAGGRSRTSARGDYRLVVKNLSRDVSWQDLKDLARRAGDVIFTDVYNGRDGFEGIIEYNHRDDVRNAFRELDNYDFKGKRVQLVEEGGTSSTERRAASPKRRSRSKSPRRSRHSRSRSRSPKRSPSPKNRDHAAPPADAAKDGGSPKKEASPRSPPK